MTFNKLMIKIVDKAKEKLDYLLRSIDENKRLEIAKDFESTVKFLMRKTKNGKGLNWLDEIKYLDRNPFVDSVKDIPSPFTKGREHKLIIRLVQSNYRIKKDGSIFLINDGGIERCKGYEFIYLYYRYKEKDDTKIKLHFVSFNIDNKYDKDKKVYQKIEYDKDN